jgi:hypothetical protein
MAMFQREWTFLEGHGSMSNRNKKEPWKVDRAKVVLLK